MIPSALVGARADAAAAATSKIRAPSFVLPVAIPKKPSRKVKEQQKVVHCILLTFVIVCFYRAHVGCDMKFALAQVSAHFSCTQENNHLTSLVPGLWDRSLLQSWC
jgi:hypothetical protein